MRIATIFATLLLAAMVAPARGQSPEAQGIEFFETKIRPVLVDQCYQCHSAEAQKNKKLRGGLLLDTRAGLLKGGDSGPAIVPGKVKDGHLLEALRYDADVKMPPKKKLPPEVLADFTKWIEMGAPDPRLGDAAVASAKSIDLEAGKKFWSFQPLGSPTLPNVKNSQWMKSPIDRFIRAKLESNGLTPNDPASRETLIRRAYFDLWGLPPTPEQIDSFLNDRDPDAYAKRVDELLAGPAYGERWGRHWLDVVRFAESGGYEFDGNRPGAYHYRDWVIKALNDDLPYDQFVRLQIAGDILKPGDYSSAAATGFLVAGPYPGQTTSKTIQLIRYNHLDDMVCTIASSMLGLTLGCARCHDHKYDPLPQNDYYRMIANLSRTDSTKANLDPQPEIYQKAKADFDAAHAPLKAIKEKFEREQLPNRATAWYEKASSTPVANWMILDPVEVQSKTPLKKLSDGSAKLIGKIDKVDSITFIAHTYQPNIQGLRIEALADSDFPNSGPGLESNGGFHLKELSVLVSPLGGKAKAVPVKLRAIEATSQATDHPLGNAVDGDAKTGWSIVPSTPGRDAFAQFAIEGKLGDVSGVQLAITLKFDGKRGAIGRPRVSISTVAAPRDLTVAGEPQHQQEAITLLRAAEGKVTAALVPKLARWFHRFDPEYDAIHKSIDELLVKTPVPQPKLTEVFAATGNRGGDVHFLIRGEVERKGAKADPGYLQVLSRSSESPAKSVDPRVALADWLTNTATGAGPLLARVIVNRLWQHHFGRGIVGTPNDFGIQGDAPTHPELLEYLARELVANGWRLKPIHKQIMLSAVYMQSDDVRPDAVKADPSNRLWWRRTPRRLEAEVIRDSLLAVGGSLDRTPFGPGTLDVNTPRRSIYLMVKRSQPIAMLQMMDSPEAIQSVGERSLTTVPTQSLAFMNSTLVRKQADNLAKLLSPIAVKNLEDAIDHGYRITLARRASPTERERMKAFIEQQAASYGSAGRDQALGDFCQVLLCLNEFVYVD